MTTVAAPNLAARQLAIAKLLTNTGYHARRVNTVISDALLPDCEWCSGTPTPANYELFHDQGSVLSCQHCLITAASVAAENSMYGEFSLEITERRGRQYVAEAGLKHGYGAYILRDSGEWSRYYLDLDTLSGGDE